MESERARERERERERMRERKTEKERGRERKRERVSKMLPSFIEYPFSAVNLDFLFFLHRRNLCQCLAVPENPSNLNLRYIKNKNTKRDK